MMKIITNVNDQHKKYPTGRQSLSSWLMLLWSLADFFMNSLSMFYDLIQFSSHAIQPFLYINIFIG